MPHIQTEASLRAGKRGHAGSTERGTNTTAEPTRAPQFEGGSVQIPTLELCSAWGCLKMGHIGPLELRIWLAAHEVAHRRRWLPRGRTGSYGASEIHELVGGGGGERAIQKGLRKLSRLGLLRWTDAGPRFLDSPETLTVDDLSAVWEMAGAMPKKRRSFPVPRRMLRLLAGGVKRSVMAAVFGHLIRCPHYSRTSGGWDPVGTCKANWVAATFGISPSSAKAARAHLVELGWLEALDAPQWYLNAYGGRFAVNLAWSREAEQGGRSGEGGAELREQVAEHRSGVETPEFSTDKSGPPQAQTGPKSGPPIENQTSLLRREKNQTPLGAKPPAGTPPKQNDVSTRQTRTSSPNLKKLTLEDLRSVPRLMEVFDQALGSPLWASKGWTPKDSYNERLNWAAAATRARARGGPNPCGLFVHLVSKRLWSHITGDDEDAVRVRVAEWWDGIEENGYARKGNGGGSQGLPGLARGTSDLLGGGASTGGPLSEDAKFARMLRQSLLQRGVLEDPFPHLERARPEWTRERWERALAELDSWRRQEAYAA